jgi:hypothetical protein
MSRHRAEGKLTHIVDDKKKIIQTHGIKIGEYFVQELKVLSI